MFRRRGRERDEQPESPQMPEEADPEGQGAPAAQDAAAGGGAPADGGTATGPWDSGGGYPEQQRLDLGSLLVPVRDGQEVRLDIADDRIVAATIVSGDSALQVQAFAAPKSGGLWDEVRGQIAEEVSRLGGQSREEQGSFGTEIHARVPAEPAAGQAAPEGMHPVRFLGVNGPRWLLRGAISGPAATRADLARPLEDAFAGIVVVRGEHPAPPRDMLEIVLPEEMRQALEHEIAQAEQGQQAEQAEQRRQYPNPFERGPEITEIR